MISASNEDNIISLIILFCFFSNRIRQLSETLYRIFGSMVVASYMYLLVSTLVFNDGVLFSACRDPIVFPSQGYRDEDLYLS